MISFIIWIIGVVLAVKAALDIWKMQGDTVKKVLFIVLLLLTSWVGIIVYYVLGHDRFANWVK